MCLFPITDKPKVAENNIVCYKVVQVSSNSNKMHPLWHFHSRIYELGKVCHEKRFDAKKSTLIGVTVVTFGFHSYIRQSRARYNVLRYVKYKNNKVIILKCVIPKGALYYEGSSLETASIEEYCSNKIMPVAWRTIYGKWHEVE
jgi:hypothetical protein